MLKLKSTIPPSLIYTHYMIRGALGGARKTGRLRKDVIRSFTIQRACMAENQPEKPTSISSILDKAPSHTFLKLLSSSFPKPSVAPVKNTSDEVKAKLINLLHSDQYNLVLSALISWTETHTAEEFRELLSPNEFSYVMEKLVNRQARIYRAMGTENVIRDDYSPLSPLALEAKDFRNGIRRIYSNVIFGGDKSQHIYHKDKRASLGDVQYDLTVKDYENLIQLELQNCKMDLASKWYLRFEQRYPDKSHYLRMSYNMWLLRFYVYGNAESRNWKVDGTLTNRGRRDRKRSMFLAHAHWLEIFNDFAKNQHLLLGNSQFMFEKSSILAVIGAMSHSKDLPQITKLIQDIWGIDSKGRILTTHKRPAKDDPCAPDVDLLSMIVVSLIYNDQTVMGLVYLNAFQEHYGVELGKDSKQLWDKVFDWAEFLSRFSEERSLQYFLRTTESKVGSKVNPSLSKAKASPNFDYEGFLTFLADLQNHRTRLIDELWGCYKESGSVLSTRAYLSRYLVLRDARNEAGIFNFLKEVASELRFQLLPEDAYNFHMLVNPTKRLRALYERAVKTLIDLKGEAGELELIEVVVRKWAIDTEMKASLERYALDNLLRFETKRREREEREAIQEQEEADGFLGLMG